MPSFNDNPASFVDLNTFFPECNEKVGLSADQVRAIVENIYWNYNHLSEADIEIGSVTVTYAAAGTPFDVNITHTGEYDEHNCLIKDILNFEFTVAVARMTATASAVQGQTAGVTITPTELQDHTGYNFAFAFTLPQGAQGIQGASFRVKGAYNSSQTYVNNSTYIDCVYYDGNMYAAIVAQTTAGTLPTDTTEWAMLVRRGYGISTVTKTGTSGLVDTYTITYEDGSTSTFEITNGATPDISGKADKVASATNGNLAALDSNGNLIDSGNKSTDFQPLIDSSHKLNADLVDDTSTTHKFVTSAEKSTWNGKQDNLGVTAQDIQSAVAQISYLTTETARLNNAKQDIIQYDTLPTAGALYVGTIYQYTGADTSTLTKGHFYECVENNGSYEWQEVDLGGSAPSNMVTTNTDQEIEATKTFRQSVNLYDIQANKLYGKVKILKEITLDPYGVSGVSNRLSGIVVEGYSLGDNYHKNMAHTNSGIFAGSAPSSLTGAINAESGLGCADSSYNGSYSWSYFAKNPANELKQVVSFNKLTMFDTGDNIITRVTNSELIDNQVILCIADSTDANVTYQEKHLYKFNYSNSTWSATDVTPSGGGSISLVTTIDAQSTDSDVPSAKAVWTLSETKQDTVDSTHKLSADLVDDTSSTNKFVTASDKTTWNAKQDTIQYSTMPTASASNTGAIVQYTGTTDSTYTNGHFYKSTENSGTYSWVEVEFGGSAPSNMVTTDTAQTISGAKKFSSTTKFYHVFCNGNLGWGISASGYPTQNYISFGSDGISYYKQFGNTLYNFTNVISTRETISSGSAISARLGATYLYTGETANGYTQYHFYKCMYDETNSSYYWLDVTPTGGTSSTILTNVSASTWVADSTYTGFGYKCVLTATGVTANDYVEVVFGVTEAMSGNYAPIAETGAGTITIYSKVDDTITIPTIKVDAV